MNQLSTVRIEIGGKHVPIFSRVSIRQWIDRHHTFELTVPIEQVEGEGGMTINRSKNFIGQEVSVSIKYQQGAGNAFTFKGFVTQLYLSKGAASGSSVVIRGFSASILLEQGTRYGAYYQKDHGAIVRKVLSEYDGSLLRPQVNPRHNQPEEYVVKFDESSYRFLHRLAAATGNWFYYDGEKTIFGDVPNDAPVSLTYGDDISSFDMRMDLPDGEFFLMDWNDAESQRPRSHSKDVRVSGLGEHGQLLIDKAEALYPERTFGYPALPVATDAAARTQVGYDKRAMVANAVIFSGSCNVIGLKVGGVINVRERSGLQGARTATFGKYRIISISHDADLGGGYSNRFEAIPEGVEFRATPSVYLPQATPQLAKVTHNDDPAHLGRVRLNFLWQTAQGDDESSTWAPVLADHLSVLDKGAYFVPEKNTLVMVDFENSDPARPIVTGLRRHKDVRQDAFYSADNHYKTIITRSGNHIVINDEPGKEFISLYNKDKKNHIQLSLDNTHITVKSEGTLNLEAGTINLKARKFNVEATDEWKVQAGKAELKTDQTMTLKANADLSVAAQTNLMMTGTAGADLKGAQVTIKGDAMTSVKGGAQLELDGGSLASLSGALVKIN